MAAPNKPAPPHAVEDTLAARGVTHFVVAWDAVSGAQRYDIRFTPEAGGASDRTDVTSGSRFDGLSPNLTYSIQIRAANNDGESPWSDPRMSCTRPLRPPAPASGLNEMTQLGVLIKWDLQAAVSGVNGSANIRVILGRVTGGQAQPISTALGLRNSTKIGHMVLEISTNCD